MADKCFCGPERAFSGSTPLGPLLDVECVRVQREWSVGRPRVWGADVRVCRQFGGGNIFLSVPLDGTVLLFLCLCLQGIRMAWRGRRGGPSDRPTKEVASPVTASLRSAGVEAPLMTGWGSPGLPDGGTRVPVLPRSLLPLLWPEAHPDDGAWWP